MKRRTLLAAAWLPLAASMPALARQPDVHVFKSPSCGCCTAWVEHLQAHGFSVRVTEVQDTSVRRRELRMPEQLGSCHTATVAGYVIEGHVPADDIARLLRDKPRALGLAVPGMPLGSPGMEAGGRRDAYDVLLVQRDGQHTVFTHYPASRKT